MCYMARMITEVPELAHFNVLKLLQHKTDEHLHQGKKSCHQSQAYHILLLICELFTSTHTAD